MDYAAYRVLIDSTENGIVVIAIELDDDGNQILPQLNKGNSAPSNIFSTNQLPLNNTTNNLVNANQATPYSQYLQTHQRPLSGGHLSNNNSAKLPFLATTLAGTPQYSFSPYNMNNSKMPSLRHESSNNLNANNNNAAAAGIAVRGQYLMINPLTSNSNPANNNDLSGNYLSTRTPENQETSNHNFNDDPYNERRSHQIPRLLTAPTSTGNRLLNQRRK